MPKQKPFSTLLRTYLYGPKPVTVQGLLETFDEKSYAILFLLLMAIPALPLPTGGLTHIFEVIVLLLAIELFIGKTHIWLPKSWLSKTLPRTLQSTVLPRGMKILQWLEGHSKQRFASLLRNPITTRLFGVIVFVFTLFALVAPPFSGLDTLPALGVVVISLALILEDGLLSLLGVFIGTTGVIVALLLGKAAFQLFS